MAAFRNHERHVSGLTSGETGLLHPTSLSPSAYNGSEGCINDRNLPSLEYVKDVFQDGPWSESAKAASPARPALSSRLLSTWSNAQQASVELTRKGSLLHSRAKSLASFVPKLNNGTSTTPDKVTTYQQPHRIFGDLFNGESAPIRLGIPPSSPTKEDSEFIMDYKPSFTAQPNDGPRRRSTTERQVSHSVAAPSKTSWFSRKPTLPAAPPPARQFDEIVSIDINSCLFPHGPADPLSPHAFNDLLLNATSLLQRMQTAYKEKVDYIASIQPEIDAQKEEVEESETRARHLKMQLEDLSRKAQEQDIAMHELATQLAEEKIKAEEAQEAAQRSIQRVRRTLDEQEGCADDGTPKWRKRGSGGSQGSDSGFESDVEYAESMMSGASSPPATTLTPAQEGEEWQICHTSIQGSDRPAISRPSSSTTAFSGKRLGSEGAAWMTIESLRGENGQLRRQMEEMQWTLQSCIDFVNVVKA